MRLEKEKEWNFDDVGTLSGVTCVVTMVESLSRWVVQRNPLLVGWIARYTSRVCAPMIGF